MSSDTETIASVKEWRPAYYISKQHRRKSLADDSVNPYALIILNQPISNRTIFSEVCNGGESAPSFFPPSQANRIRPARYVVCADGGANQLRKLSEKIETRVCHSLWQSSSQSILTYLQKPDAICGDLDSISDDVKEYYHQQGVQIVKDPDQNSTDFTKCLKYIKGKTNKTIDDENSPPENRQSRQHGLDIAVIGGLGGRADQAFSQLHHLFAASKGSSPSKHSSPSKVSSLVNGDIYLITPESIIFLLEKGVNKIYTPVSPDLLAENVGIIPLSGPSRITTEGLEWNLTDWETDFEVQISTSNHIRSEIVKVTTTERVLFTVELAVKP